MKLNENGFQKELVKSFVNKGWTEGPKYLNLINKPIFRKGLSDFLYKKYKLMNESELDEIISNVNSKLTNDWFSNNKLGFLDFLSNGIATEHSKTNKEPSYKLIDLEDVKINNFMIFQEVWTAADSRQDVMLMVNGLPFYNFELKSFSRQTEKTTVDAAISQIKTYSLDSPKSFTFNIASIALNQWSNAFIGSPSSDRKFWFKLIKGDDLNTFFDFFSFDNIKNYLEAGILFGKSNIKKLKYILRHHQIGAVKSSIKAIKKGRGGYIWHTQGSGKTITISSLLSALPSNGLASFTTIIDVDRNSLAQQIKQQLNVLDERHFSSTIIRMFKSSQELRTELSNSKYRGIYITTTQKFNEYKLLTNRDDILFVSDEAHRTHSDKLQVDGKTSYFENIQKSLPNSLKIGFTGTPIFSGYTKTFEMFGDLLHKYTMKQAEDDGIITPISYSYLKTTLSLDQSLLKGIDPGSDISKSKVIDNAPARIKVISDQIGNIFMNKTSDFLNQHGNEGDVFKAMFVVNSVKSGYAFYKELKEWFKNHSILGSEIANQIGFVVSNQDRLKRDDHELHDAISKINNKEIIDDFKKPQSKYKILIVKDMLLTGYDVKNLRLMFFDRYIHSHNLLQAIARVNRTFKNKSRGEVITFRDITSELTTALEVYRGTTNEDATIDISKDVEAGLSKSLVSVEKILGKEFSKITEGISFTLNSLAIMHKDDVVLLNELKKIKSEFPLVYKWENKENKRSAGLANMLFISMTREENEARIISANDDDFEKILNSIVVDNDIYMSVDDVTLSELIEGKLSDKISSSELIQRKVIKDVNSSTGMSKRMKKSLILKLKEIIFKYNNEVISIEELKINLEVINNHLSKVNAKPQIIQMLISSIENVLDVSEPNIDDKKVGEIMEESFAGDWWLTENSKRNGKAAIFKFLIENNIAGKETAKKITDDFLERAISETLKYKGENNEI